MRADPFAGDPDGMRSLVRRITADAASVSDGRGFVHDALSLAHGSWKGAAAHAFTERASSLGPAAARAAAQLEAMADVLRDYAAEVTRIQDDARQIRSAQASVADDVARAATAVRDQRRLVDGPDAVEADAVQLARMVDDAASLDAERSRLDERWDELVQRRANSDRRAAAGLSDEQTLGWFASFAAAEGSTDEAFLAALAALGPRAIEVLGADEFVASRLRSMTAEQVAAWWDAMGGRERDAFIAAFPAVIGNLDGVAYRARDKANRICLEEARRAAKHSLARAEAARASAIGREQTARAQRELAAASEHFEALKNFGAGATTRLNAETDLVRQLISFRDGRPPLGAFSVGDLDTASNVSWLVPGMGTTLKDTTVLMRAGSNIIAQHQLAGRFDTAVVAWVGYEAPPNSISTGSSAVFGNAHAQAGAEHLIRDIGGYRARNAHATVNVIAHSYGSTTASLALHREPALDVHAFVTLGSAGIPQEVANASKTNASRMIAVQADERFNVAQIGRQMSFPERSNPAFHFGAESIDTSAADGRPQVNVHDLMTGNEDDDGDHGYLDARTNSLFETARATIQ